MVRFDELKRSGSECVTELECKEGGEKLLPEATGLQSVTVAVYAVLSLFCAKVIKASFHSPSEISRPMEEPLFCLLPRMSNTGLPLFSFMQNDTP